MKRLILIKEGEYRSNLFSDFSEFVNNDYTEASDPFQNFQERCISNNPVNFGFFARTDFSMRLSLNTAAKNPSKKIALIHYRNNPEDLSFDADIFKPLDFEAICTAADKYGAVVYGFVSTDNVIPDYTAFKDATILVRDKEQNKIYDVLNDKYIDLNKSYAPTVSYFGVVKVKDLPIYYVILDPKILKIAGGLEIDNDFMSVRVISDHDRSIKENIMTPQFSGDTEILAKYHVFTKEDELTIFFFNSQENILIRTGFNTSFAKIAVKTNFDYTLLPGGGVRLKINAAEGYLKVKMLAGDFFDVVSTKDDLTYEYIIKKI